MNKTCLIICNEPKRSPWKDGEGENHKGYLTLIEIEIDELIGHGCTYFYIIGHQKTALDFAKALREVQPFIEVQYETVTMYNEKDERLYYEYFMRFSDVLFVYWDGETSGATYEIIRSVWWQRNEKKLIVRDTSLDILDS